MDVLEQIVISMFCEFNSALTTKSFLSRLNDSSTISGVLHTSPKYNSLLIYSCPLKQMIVSRFLLDSSSYQNWGLADHAATTYHR